MRTIKLAVIFMLFAVFAAAQVRIAPASMEQDMRIFTKEGEDSIVFFPSAYLDYKPKINIVFPEGYNKPEARFCSIYIINKEEYVKDSVYSDFQEADAKRCLFVNIRFNSVPASKALENFIGRELMPYIETNYKASGDNVSKVLLAGEGYSSSVINNLGGLSNYFGNFALMFYNSTAMPSDLTDINKNVSVWALGSVGNMARLQNLFEGAGLQFYSNFAYNILNTEGNKPPALASVLNLKYLLDKAICKPIKSKAVFSVSSASATSEESFAFWLDIKGKKGCRMDYIPTSVKIAPPFLSWDFGTASFKVIYGAQPGKVKISGFIGDVLAFDESFKITK